MGAGTREAVATDPLKVIEAFDAMVLNHQVREAVELYVAPDFIEHNPNVRGGTREGLIAYLETEAIDVGRNPHTEMRDIVDRRIAAGEFVVTQHHVFCHAGDPGIAISDTFRVIDGRIVEHWDIHQEVPRPKDNPLTMW